MITLGVLVISSEYGTGMIRTTLTACPSRSRVLTAKAVVFFSLAFSITTVACGLVAMADSSMLSGSGSHTPSGSQWLRATVGIGLYVALLGLLALAVGTMLRHSAGAITAMLGLVLLPLILALFMQIEQPAQRPAGPDRVLGAQRARDALRHPVPGDRPEGVDAAVGAGRRDRGRARRRVRGHRQAGRVTATV